LLHIDKPSDVIDAFAALTREGVRYALIRRNPDSPWEVGGDIDVLVDPADGERTEEFLVGRGFVRVPKRPPGTGVFFRQISPIGLITIHVQDRIYYRGTSTIFLDRFASQVLGTTVADGGVRYASPELNRLLVLGRLKYEGASISAKYREILGDEASWSIEEFDSFVQKYGIVERREKAARRGPRGRWLEAGAR
jgi:hypothetical protein